MVSALLMRRLIMQVLRPFAHRASLRSRCQYSLLVSDTNIVYPLLHPDTRSLRGLLAVTRGPRQHRAEVLHCNQCRQIHM